MISKKIVICGSFSVGKSSLFNRFIENRFDERYLTTIGVRVNKRSVNVNSQDVSLLLWDIAGEVSQDKVPTTYYLGAAGIIYVFDLSRPQTYLNIESDLTYLKNLLPYAHVRLVGNKKDLLTAQEIQEKLPTSIQALCNTYTSAKTGENVEELFEELAMNFISVGVR